MLTGRAPDLAAALAYTNRHVEWKFLEAFAVDEEVATALFADTRRWLWLKALARHEADAGVLDPPLELVVTPALGLLDEMWHTFLLFTRAYREFCDAALGGYVDHEPNIPERFQDPDPRAVDRRRAAVTSRLERQLRYVHDRLGPEVVVRWYVDHLEAFPEPVIAGLHRWAARPTRCARCSPDAAPADDAPAKAAPT